MTREREQRVCRRSDGSAMALVTGGSATGCAGARMVAETSA